MYRIRPHNSGGRSLPCIAAIATIALLTARPASAQVSPPPYHIQDVRAHSGVHDNPGDDWVMAFEHTFTGGKAPWSRLEFAGGNLGKRSVVLLTGLDDGQEQSLDPELFSYWRRGSAIFRGGRIRLQLLIAPGDEGVFIDVPTMLVGDNVVGNEDTICGSGDNRVPSNDPRVGRLFFGGCTAWLVSNGAVLTAGHCVDFDPDQGGPLLPDGVADISGVVEFNIPPSNSDGTTNPALVEDQYPIDFIYLAWRFDGEGQGLGKDWGVFSIGPNTLNQRAHFVQGFFRCTRAGPSSNATTRITGCGSDGGTANFTLQTSTGPYEEEESSGANIWHRYRVDTTGGNSGSPVIWNSLNVAIGIHTNGGCTESGGANSGTSFEVNQLETFFHGFQGNSVEYVDNGMPIIGGAVPDGQIYRPWTSIVNGVSALPSGGTLSIVAGSYDETLTITKPMTIRTPVGGVVIGE